jgi:hypothetical protein
MQEMNTHFSRGTPGRGAGGWTDENYRGCFIRFCCAAGLVEAGGSVKSVGRVFALKGRNKIAQGLGPGFVDRHHMDRPEGAGQGDCGRVVPPFQGGIGWAAGLFPRAEALGCDLAPLQGDKRRSWARWSMRNRSRVSRRHEIGDFAHSFHQSTPGPSPGVPGEGTKRKAPPWECADRGEGAGRWRAAGRVIPLASGSLPPGSCSGRPF